MSKSKNPVLAILAAFGLFSGIAAYSEEPAPVQPSEGVKSEMRGLNQKIKQDRKQLRADKKARAELKKERRRARRTQ